MTSTDTWTRVTMRITVIIGDRTLIALGGTALGGTVINPRGQVIHTGTALRRGGSCPVIHMTGQVISGPLRVTLGLGYGIVILHIGHGHGVMITRIVIGVAITSMMNSEGMSFTS